VADRGDLPPFPLDTEKLLSVLVAHGVDYLLVGGSAVLLYGVGIRETYDLDIVPDPTSANLERLGAALRELDAKVITYWAEVKAELHVDESTFSPEVFAENPYLHLLTRLGRIDVLLHPPGAPGGFDQLAAGAVKARVGQVEVALPAMEDLVRMKEAVGRPKDLEDLVALRAAVQKRARARQEPPR
jgi:hypothetical protein